MPNQDIPPDQYSNMVVSLIVLGAVVIGVLAMLVRFLAQRAQRTNAVEEVRDQQHQQAAQTYSQRETPAASSNEQPRIPMARWVAHLNNYPEDYPHVLIVGATRSGKTSLARALLRWRDGEVAIVGVKASANWGDGYVFRSADRAPYLAALRAEIERRLELDTPQPLTVVLDDYATLAAESKDAVAIFKRVASDGAEKLVRLVVTAEGDTADALGLEGRAYAKSHFVTLRCYQSKQAAMLVWNDEAWKFVPQRIDTAEVPRYAAPLPAVRFWQSVEQPAALSSLGSVGQSQPQPQPQPRLRVVEKPDFSEAEVSASPSASPAPAFVGIDPVVWTCPDNGLEATRSEVLALLATDKTEAEIVKTLWQIDATKGARYKAAQAVVASIRAAALAEVAQAA